MKEIELKDIISLLAETGDQDDRLQSELSLADADKSLRGLGFDSLAMFNFVVVLESKYNIHLTLDEIIIYETPLQLFDIINDKSKIKNKE